MSGRGLAALARRLIRVASDQGIRSAAAALKRESPKLAEQIRTDGRRRGLLSRWGSSLNVDEIANREIVHPHLLSVIALLAERTIDVTRPHAGLQHTYGYLLSLIRTPYGPKRTRWTSGEIVAGFGLPRGVFGPQPEAGTLLANATLLAGRLAWSHASEVRGLQALARHVHPDVAAMRTTGLAIRRVTESIAFRSRNGRDCDAVLETHLIRYPRPTRAPWLLIYSVRDSRRRRAQLVTLFSIGDESVDEICSRSGRRTDLRTRYNAFVPGVTGREFTGVCRVSRRGG